MDVKGIKKRFETINQERLGRTRAALRPQQQDVLDMLPLLFHVNHPALPGFVSTNTPSGISNYIKEGQAIMAARRIVRGFDYRRSLSRMYHIHALFLIGSAGTIAHSSKSDFDVWLCHSPDLDAQQSMELREKCARIEKWAEGYNLEVHFFLMDANRFRCGEVLDLSSESSGTAQHHLLLDEFYRTGLWLAGRVPVWWFVPPEEESNYDEFVADLEKRRHIQPGETIDFGGLGHMPAEEFFGAAVWQIYKGVDSPYKSVLKILLMEIYAQEYPDVEFLSLMYKRAIYENTASIDMIDPYIMLLDKLTGFLRQKKSWERLELVRRCFYFKINLPLSRMRYVKGSNWQQDLMMQMVDEWKWHQSDISNLDGRNHWKIEQVMLERKALIDELTQSYFALSEFARNNAGLVMISQKDLNVLGRKLYAAFERKAGKVDIINRGFSADLHEPMVSFVQRKAQGGRDSWYVYRADGLNSEDLGTPLKRASNVIELIVWCYFNRIIDRRTAFSLKTQSSDLHDRELHSIISALQEMFPEGRTPSVDIEDFSQKPRLLAVALFINTGIEAASSKARLGHLITDRTDALSFGAANENLIHTLDAVFITSWQEVLTFHYEGPDGLMDCLVQYLQWSPLTDGLAPPKARTFCFSSSHSDKISRRISQIFHHVTDTYFKKYGPETELRYVMAVERGYSMLYVDDGVLKHIRMGSYAELLEHLARPRDSYSPVLMDPSVLRKSVLAAVFEYGKAGVVQFYFHVTDKTLNLYVLDEKGSLFYQSMPLADPRMILSHYHAFLKSIMQRRAFATDDALSDEERVECYQLQTKGKGTPVVERRALDFRTGSNCFKVQVIGDPNDISTGFTVYCNEREFSTAEYGENIFLEVARSIMAQRQSGQSYPIYITDIDVPYNLLGAKSHQHVQTLHYLIYKKKVEDRLNQALGMIQGRSAAL